MALANALAAANTEIGLHFSDWGPAWNWLHFLAVLNLCAVAVCYRLWRQTEDD